MTLIRAQTLFANATGGDRHFRQYAIEARSDAKHFFVRLKVDIRSAALDGIEQDFVDKADNWRVFNIVARDVILLVIIAGRLRDSRDRNRRRPMTTWMYRRLRAPLLMRSSSKRLIDNDRIDAEAGLKLDVIDRLQVRRIGNAQEKGADPRFIKRQHAVLVQAAF